MGVSFLYSILANSLKGIGLFHQSLYYCAAYVVPQSAAGYKGIIGPVMLPVQSVPLGWGIELYG